MAERKFLVDINLNGNQLNNVRLQNATGNPSVGNGGIYYKSTDNKLYFNKNGTWTALAEGGVAITSIELTGDVTGTAVVTNGAAAISTTVSTEVVQDITGAQLTTNATHNGVSVSYDDAGSGGISITNTDKGSSQNIFKTIAVSGQSDVVADSNTDTLTLATTGSGLAITTNATTDTVTFENTGVVSVAGTSNQVSVAGTGTGPYTGAITLSLPQDIHTGASPTFAGVTAGNITVGVTTDNTINTSSGNLTINSAGGTVTVDDNLVISGDLTVQGTLTSIDTTNTQIKDNIITLNDGVTGSPALNAGIEINRGTSTNASLLWNESIDVWQAGVVGSEKTILLDTVASLSNLANSTEDVQDIVGDSNFTKGTNSLSVTYDDNGNTLTFDTILASSNSYLTKTSGLAVDKTNLESALVTDGFTKKYSVNNGSISASGGVFPWTVTHNLNSEDVVVQMREVSTKQIVEPQIVNSTSNTVTISINDTAGDGTLAENTYRVVVIG